MLQPKPARPIIYKYDSAVAQFVDRFWKENYRSPSIREIALAIHSSTSMAHLTVKRIAAARGDLLLTGSARGIVPKWVKEAISEADTANRRKYEQAKP